MVMYIVNAKELRSFLVLAWYYQRFVQDSATFERPLHWQKWVKKFEAAFEQLREVLGKDPVLMSLDPTKPEPRQFFSTSKCLTPTVPGTVLKMFSCSACGTSNCHSSHCHRGVAIGGNTAPVATPLWTLCCQFQACGSDLVSCRAAQLLWTVPTPTSLTSMSTINGVSLVGRSAEVRQRQSYVVGAPMEWVGVDYFTKWPEAYQSVTTVADKT